MKLQYTEEKAKLQKELSEQKAVALTCDFWTSNATHSYITATAHYIDINWILRHPVLATRRVIGHHTGELISGVLDSMRQEFNIHDKVAGLTTDNASNMRKAGSLQVFTTCKDATVSCMAHTLQLAVEDGLKAETIQNAAAQCRRCIGHFNKSNLASDALESYQIKQNPNKKPLKVIQDVCTRWNSLYLMFQRMELLRAAMYAVLHDKSITKPADCQAFEIPNETWNLMADLLPVLKPMVDATEALSSESYPSVSCIIPMIVGLIKNDLAPKECDTEVIETFKCTVIVGLRSRFPMPNDSTFPQSALAAAILLDPRHKSLAVIEDIDVKEQLKQVVFNMMKADIDPGTLAKEELHSPAKKQRTVSSYLEGDFSDEDGEQDTLDSELNEYLHEKVTRRSTRDPLLWWKVNESRFPNVAKLARKFLCIMGTSVPSERVFSTAGLVVTSKRSQLHPESVDEIIFLNKALKRKYTEESGLKDKTNEKEELPKVKMEPLETPSDKEDDEDPPLPELY